MFIYSKMDHKINKIRRKLMYQWKAQDLTIEKIHLFSQYDDHERVSNYKPVSDMCSSLILS